MKKKIKQIIVILLIFISFNFTGCSYYDNKKIENIIVSESENYKVYLKNFMFFFNNMRESRDYYLENNLGFTKEDKLKYWNTKNGDKTIEEDVKSQVLDMLQYQSVALNLAKEKDIKLTNKEKKQINKEVNNFIMSLGNIKKRGEKVLLEKYEISPKDLKNLQEELGIIRKYLDELSKNHEISEEEISEFYDKNKDLVEKNIDVKVTVRHILIKCDDSIKKEKIKEKEELAKSLLKRIENGENIEKLVKEYSEDEGSINNNGEYTFARGEMVKEFEDWSFNANVGDVGIVKTQFGYHIVKLISKPSEEDINKKRNEFITKSIKEEESIKILDNEVNHLNLKWKINKDVYNNIKIEYINDNEEDEKEDKKENKKEDEKEVKNKEDKKEKEDEKEVKNKEDKKENTSKENKKIKK